MARQDNLICRTFSATDESLENCYHNLKMFKVLENYQKKVLNLFKVNNRGTRVMLFIDLFS